MAFCQSSAVTGFSLLCMVTGHSRFLLGGLSLQYPYEPASARPGAVFPEGILVEAGLCFCNLPALIKAITLLSWTCGVSLVGQHFRTVKVSFCGISPTHFGHPGVRV